VNFKVALMAGFAVACFSGGALAQKIDEDAAKALMKKSDCGKCHALDKKKDGPPYKETAKKYKGKPDAEQKLYTHLTTNPEVEVEGKKEKHKNLKSKNEDDIRNVVRWILSR